MADKFIQAVPAAWPKGLPGKDQIMAIAERLLKPQAERARMTIQEYAASKNMAKCDICGLWGTKDSEMLRVGDILPPTVLTWRCKTHAPRPTSTQETY